MLSYVRCKECEQEVEWYRPYDYDGPDYCPECQSIDSFIYEGEEE
jgi:Zn finger protein HypA/HybF involved in hydrogenase expression